MSAGVSGQALKLPESEGDVERFLRQMKQHPDYLELQRRLAPYITDVEKPEQLIYWSTLKHRTAKGRWLPKRRQIHREIIRQLLNPDSYPIPGFYSQAVILIGPPGAGKTKVGVPITMSMGVDFTVINSDDVKVRLPEYQGWNASLLHEESSYIAEEILPFLALTEKRNVLYDLTGSDSLKIVQIAQDLAADEYEVHVIFVDLPAWKSAGRAWDRFQTNPFNRNPHLDPGRWVSPDYVYRIVDGGPVLTYECLRKLPEIRSWRRYNSDVPFGSDAILIDEGRR